MHGHEEGASGRCMMKDPANTIVKARLQQGAERMPWVAFFLELPFLMAEKLKSEQKDFEFLSSWLLWEAEGGADKHLDSKA